MDDRTFSALVAHKLDDGNYSLAVEQKSMDDLPEHEVLVRVRWTSLNYKDALSATGNRGVTKQYPHTPGIDAAGEVIEDLSGTFEPGDPVVVTGYDLGMNTPGGFGQYIRVPAAWALPLPQPLSMRDAMVFGTAGFTAGLSVLALLDAGITPADGPVLVTGARGGVGSHAVRMLASEGFRVIAATGLYVHPGEEFPADRDYLLSIGAAEVVPKEQVEDTGHRPLLKERWAAAVDTVGGLMLTSALRATMYAGAVTTCGNAGGHELNLTVYPFILRGIRLLGIDSVQAHRDLRQRVWERIATNYNYFDLASMATDCNPEDMPALISTMLHGHLRGRRVMRLS